MSESIPEVKSELNLENYVPKEDHAKQLAEKDTALKSAKAEAEKANMQLLDPSYLDFLESKKQKPQAKVSSKESESSDVAELRSQLSQVTQAVREMGYQAELKATRDKYTDFDDHLDDIKVLLSKKDYSYEDAYKLVKTNREESKEVSNPKKDKAPFFTEKPNSTVPAKALEPKEYKTAEESDKATINALRDKYPGLGDTI